ncbi:MAG: Cupin [Thermoanaerobaculia bacterium]|jgi:mannose-6-phosphate isomerase-like protein (cupin superfamily)|nr:Cupin [Thermoanaerobaculia bacterium]
MTYIFTVAGGESVVLDDIANQLRAQIAKLPPNSPLLAKQQLAAPQSSVTELLLVVRSQEDPHTHPQSDLIFSVLEGGGYVELSDGRIEAPAGTTVLIPRGVCHAYHNTADADSVLLATFPAKPEPGKCVAS